MKIERKELTMQDILACVRIIFIIIIFFLHQYTHLYNEVFIVVSYTN